MSILVLVHLHGQRGNMPERTTTSYGELLRRISAAQLVDQTEANRLVRILAI